MRAPNVCFVITEDWYFWSHRRHLADDLVRRGSRVDVVCNLGSGLREQMEASGFIPHSVGMQRAGKNPWEEARGIQRMAQLFRELKPDVVHLVGMKPIVYGSIAARLAGVPVTVCAIAGLGWLFTPGGMLKSAARMAVQTQFRQFLAGRPGIQFLVQNTHHRDTLIQTRMAKASQVSLVHGAGIDSDRFKPAPEPDGPPVILTHARMLWDKGIGEVVEAARIVRRSFPDVRFQLVGDPDSANPASIPQSQLEQWNSEGVVEWQPRRNDIPELLAGANIACLPSHHEGFPLSLVEALSCGRAVVTTDIPGCRDVVSHQKSGLLVPTQNVESLSSSILQLVNNPELRKRFGRVGRQSVLERMSCRIVNEATWSVYQSSLAQVGWSGGSDVHRKRAA